MGERKYYETERYIFCVSDEYIVYQMRITKSKEEAYQFREIYIKCAWKDPSMPARLMENKSRFNQNY
jgi:hypothetical protein